jgi:hypothetical protein
LCPPQVVVAGMTCGDALYSIGSRKFLDQRVANLEKCSDCKGKGLPNSLIHITVSAGLFVRRTYKLESIKQNGEHEEEEGMS